VRLLDLRRGSCETRDSIFGFVPAPLTIVWCYLVDHHLLGEGPSMAMVDVSI